MKKITFQAGDIFATKARGPIAWLHERLFIPRTDRFHFGFIAGRTRDGDYEIRESISKGVALGRLFQHYRSQDIEVYRVADPHFAGKIAVEALSKIGRTRYDYVLVARIALNIVKLLVTGKLPPWTASQLDYARDRRFVCTEAVAFGCRQEGHPLVPAGVAPLPSEFKQAELNGKIRRIFKRTLGEKIKQKAALGEMRL